jgi:hypothetical protein
MGARLFAFLGQEQVVPSVPRSQTRRLGKKRLGVSEDSIDAGRRPATTVGPRWAMASDPIEAALAQALSAATNAGQ